MRLQEKQSTKTFSKVRNFFFDFFLPSWLNIYGNMEPHLSKSEKNKNNNKTFLVKRVKSKRLQLCRDAANSRKNKTTTVKSGSTNQVSTRPSRQVIGCWDYCCLAAARLRVWFPSCLRLTHHGSLRTPGCLWTDVTPPSPNFWLFFFYIYPPVCVQRKYLRRGKREQRDEEKRRVRRASALTFGDKQWNYSRGISTEPNYI